MRVLRKIPFTLPLVLSLSLLLVAAGCAGVASAAPVARLIAPAAVCPEVATDAPAVEQERAMLCLTNFARRAAGLHGLALAADLERSAVHKSADILRCDSFSHEACGRAFTYWMQRLGYLDAGCWRAGENIAWGSGRLGGVGSIFRAWMHSPGHRENILGRYAQIGIGLEVGGLDGYAGAHVWTQDFCSHC